MYSQPTILNKRFLAAFVEDRSELIGHYYNMLISVVKETKARKTIYLTTTSKLRKSRRTMAIFYLSKQILFDVKSDFVGMEQQIGVARLS